MMRSNDITRVISAGIGMIIAWQLLVFCRLIKRGIITNEIGCDRERIIADEKGCDRVRKAHGT